MSERILKFKQALKAKQNSKKSSNEGNFSKEMKQLQESKGEEKHTNTSKQDKEGDELKKIPRKPLIRGDPKKARKRPNEKSNILEDILQASQRLNASKKRLAVRPANDSLGRELKPPTIDKKQDSGKKDLWVDEEVISTVGIFSMGKTSKPIQRNSGRAAKGCTGRTIEGTHKDTVEGCAASQAQQQNCTASSEAGKVEKSIGPGLTQSDLAELDDADLGVFQSVREEIQKIAFANVPKSQISKKIQAIDNLLQLSSFGENCKRSLEQEDSNCRLLDETAQMANKIEKVLSDDKRLREPPKSNISTPHPNNKAKVEPPLKKPKLPPPPLVDSTFPLFDNTFEYADQYTPHHSAQLDVPPLSKSFFSEAEQFSHAAQYPSQEPFTHEYFAPYAPRRPTLIPPPNLMEDVDDSSTERMPLFMRQFEDPPFSVAAPPARRTVNSAPSWSKGFYSGNDGYFLYE